MIDCRLSVEQEKKGSSPKGNVRTRRNPQKAYSQATANLAGTSSGAGGQSGLLLLLLLLSRRFLKILQTGEKMADES